MLSHAFVKSRSGDRLGGQYMSVLKRVMFCGHMAVLTLLPSWLFASEPCVVCDAEIVMTRSLADCFLGIADGQIAEMKKEGRSFQLVNLGICDGVASKSRGGETQADSSRKIFDWSDIKGATTETPRTPTLTFILDEAGIRCLKTRIEKGQEIFDPAGAFRPAEMCK